MLPLSARCIPERTANAVTIHGLWPNYLHGYPSCCNSQPGSVPFNLPLDPVGYVATYPAPNPLSAEEMDKIWLDPATTDAYQSLCNIFNHEWQKHGLCLGYWDDTMNLTVRAAQYFRKTIETAGLVSEATSQLESWAAEEHSPSVDEIRGLYPKQIQLWCATGDADGPGLNRFMAVRTCWNTSKTAWEPTEMLDCPRETPYSSFGICDEASPVRLDKYARSGGAPGAEATSSAVGAPLLSVWLPAAVWVILTSSNPFAA